MAYGSVKKGHEYVNRRRGPTGRWQYDYGQGFPGSTVRGAGRPTPKPGVTKPSEVSRLPGKSRPRRYGDR